MLMVQRLLSKPQNCLLSATAPLDLVYHEICLELALGEFTANSRFLILMDLVETFCEFKSFDVYPHTCQLIHSSFHELVM